MCEHLKGCDVLLHFAAEKHNNSKELPQLVVDTNVSATLRLFEAAGQVGIRKIVFASSLYAYGRYSGSNMTEHEVPQPKTVYGVTKLTGEGLARYINDKYGVAVTIVRLFFVYGPRQYVGLGYPSVIVRNFIRILNGERPIIFGDGRQELDYVNVADVVAAIDQLLLTENDLDLFNISTGKGVSINHLTELMLEVAESSLQPFHSEPDWTIGSRRVGDFSRLSSATGWYPQVNLQVGLKEVYDWLQETSSVLK
jgi:UDP-glucose 4-epimerase